MRVPIKTCYWSTIVRIRIPRNFVLNELICLFVHFPYPKALCCSRQYVLSVALDVRDPHHLRRWEVVLELVDLAKPIVRLSQIEADNVDLVVHCIGVVACHCHVEFIVFPISKCYGVVLEVTFVRVDLLCLTVFRLLVYLVLELVLNRKSCSRLLAHWLVVHVLSTWSSIADDALLHLELLLLFRRHVLQHLLLFSFGLVWHACCTTTNCHHLLVLLHEHLFVLSIYHLLGCTLSGTIDPRRVGL